jgi:signal transduction histidine kinase
MCPKILVYGHVPPSWRLRRKRLQLLEQVLRNLISNVIKFRTADSDVFVRSNFGVVTYSNRITLRATSPANICA